MAHKTEPSCAKCKRPSKAKLKKMLLEAGGTLDPSIVAFDLQSALKYHGKTMGDLVKSKVVKRSDEDETSEIIEYVIRL